MDDRQRDKFYSGSPIEDAEDDELELEPPDAEVLAGEERRARETIESTLTNVDVDEIYREAEHDRSREILENWFRNFQFRQFRFRVKHLLIATAVLAILLTFGKLGWLGFIVPLSFMLFIAGLFIYLQWQDRKHQAEVERRRRELYDRRRAQLQSRSSSGGAPAATATEARQPLPPLANEVDEIWQEANAKRDFHFRFSMQQLMIAVTVAAVIFGMAHLLGGPIAAVMLGLGAVLGLVIYAAGYEPPEIVVFGWWIILAMYVLLSIAGALWSAST